MLTVGEPVKIDSLTNDPAYHIMVKMTRAKVLWLRLMKKPNNKLDLIMNKENFEEKSVAVFLVVCDPPMNEL
jgi:hypothetical protein